MHHVRWLILLVVLVAPARAQSVRFAIIGDYGTDDAPQAAVADRVKLSNPDSIFTVGDNNYFLGGGIADWDRTQGKYYGDFIKYPAGSGSAYAGNGVTTNRFFPALGNHDWDAGIAEYTDYFELPGNERYFSVVKGPVEFFILDSDIREPDGRTTGSTQFNWAHNAIQSSSARWQVVLFHHPAYSYGPGTETTEMRWPFAVWGADAVVSGHIHNMQRMTAGGLPYYVSGTGGRPLTNAPASPSGATGLFYDDAHFGFLQLDASTSSMTFRFIDTDGNVLDTSVVPEPVYAGLLGLIPLLIRCKGKTPMREDSKLPGRLI